MAPTLEPGDRVLAWSLGGRDPRRGEIVIFEPPPDASLSGRGFSTVVSRVVGVGGDRVAVADGGLTLTGRVVEVWSSSAQPAAVTACSRARSGRPGLLGPVRAMLQGDLARPTTS